MTAASALEVHILTRSFGGRAVVDGRVADGRGGAGDLPSGPVGLRQVDHAADDCRGRAARCRARSLIDGRVVFGPGVQPAARGARRSG